jgi:hypothetical protein
MSRRSLLAGTGCAVAASTVGQMLAAVARAQEAAAPGLCMTMMFMQGQRAKFEADEYEKKHLPMLRQVYGDSVARIELRTTASSATGIPSAILATSTIWIRDVAGFSQKLGANAAQINKELDEISRGNRQVQVDRIALVLGETSEEVPDGSHVLSLFYPAAAPAMRGMGMGGAGMGGAGMRGGRGASRGGAAPAPPAPSSGSPEGPRFDPAQFVDVFLPRLYSLFGPGTVRRVEGTIGMEQGGQKPAHFGACHIVIRDRAAYDSQSGSVFTELQKDSGQFTSVFPTLADLRVAAIA